MRIDFRDFRTGDEFDVEVGDFGSLEIRASAADANFCYFFDTRTNRLITNFVIEERQRVSTLINVTLIKRDHAYTPRLRFWKKDKTKLGRITMEQEITEAESTRTIKAAVDTGDAHRNFWKVINFLQSLSEVSLPVDRFRLVSDDAAELAHTLEGVSKETVIEAVRRAVGSKLTEHDIQLLSNRRQQLERFDRLLHEDAFFESERIRLGKTPEALWQDFFEANPWIFGYGLNLVACQPLDDQKLERITTGANIFTGAGKRIDAILRTKGYISSLAFCEIKTHKKELLERKPYREPDVYQVSKEVSGGLSQIQKTVSKALLLIAHQLHSVYKSDGTPTEIQVSTVKPLQVLVVGNLAEFSENGAINPEKMASFELYRKSIADVEIITFDELYERAAFIVRDA
ncbi:Shedu immune nuclease family protein [Streptomyces sp. B6B3]|uniref:Shedu immune nuclease family protein n=1 Tax=Streptomyces sp. B6B3 TaxID=3153570 RepID=UPI00325F4B28